MLSELLATGLTAGAGVVAATPGAASVTRSKTSTRSALKQGLAFYREKTITIIEPGATGAIFDLLARTDAQNLSKYLHATVNVRDVTTGNTITGQDDTAGAPPNGLTLGELNLGVDMTLALTRIPPE